MHSTKVPQHHVEYDTVPYSTVKYDKVQYSTIPSKAPLISPHRKPFLNIQRKIKSDFYKLYKK